MTWVQSLGLSASVPSLENTAPPASSPGVLVRVKPGNDTAEIITVAGALELSPMTAPSLHSHPMGETETTNEIFWYKYIPHSIWDILIPKKLCVVHPKIKFNRASCILVAKSGSPEYRPPPHPRRLSLTIRYM